MRRGCSFEIDLVEIDFPSPFVSLPIFEVSRAPRVWAVGSLFAPSPETTKVVWPVEKIRYANGTLRDFAEHFDEKLHGSAAFDPDTEFACYVIQLLQPREVSVKGMDEAAALLTSKRPGNKIHSSTLRAIELREDNWSHRAIAEAELRSEGRDSKQMTPVQWRDLVEERKKQVAGKLEYHRKEGKKVRRAKEYFRDPQNYLLVYRRAEKMLIVDSPGRRSEE